MAESEKQDDAGRKQDAGIRHSQRDELFMDRPGTAQLQTVGILISSFCKDLQLIRKSGMPADRNSGCRRTADRR